MLEFDAKALAEAMRDKRGDMSYRAVASNALVSEGILRWIEQRLVGENPSGHVLTILKYRNLCAWLGVPMETFFEGGENGGESADEAQERLNPNLDCRFKVGPALDLTWNDGWDARGEWEGGRRVIAKPIKDEEGG